MFNTINKVEGYIFDENEKAYSNLENRKNYLKEEVTAKFIELSKKSSCCKLTGEKDEIKTKYVAEFDDRIPLSIIIYNSSLEINHDLVKALNKCVFSKQKIVERKIEIRNKVLLATILAAGTITLLAVGPGIRNKIVELDNKQFNEETQTSQELYDEQMRYDIHQEAIEQYYEDQNMEEQQIHESKIK